MSIKETKVNEVIVKVVISVCISLVFGFCPLQAYGQNEEDVQTFVTVMDRKNVADNFGSRIAKRYIGIQVTVQNTNEKFKYLIHDISLDLNEVFLDPEELR